MSYWDLLTSHKKEAGIVRLIANYIIIHTYGEVTETVAELLTKKPVEVQAQGLSEQQLADLEARTADLHNNTEDVLRNLKRTGGAAQQSRKRQRKSANQNTDLLEGATGGSTVNPGLSQAAQAAQAPQGV